jgi:hypothetical protein
MATRIALAAAVCATALALLFLAFAAPRAHGKDDPVAPRQPVPRDAAALRLELLARLDADIDERAAQAHLDARILLDRVLPVPYLGVDAEPHEGGMRVTKVFPLTGAEEAGVIVGDVLADVAGRPTPDAAALGGAIRESTVGSRLALGILRDGARVELTALLGSRPEEDEDESEQFPTLAAPETDPPAALSVPFTDAAPGSLPGVLETVLSGHGRPGRWIVVEEPEGAFLRQDDDDPTGIRFPTALVRDFESLDATIRVRFRSAGGRQDRAAGVILRWQDRWNYIVARANAVEGDLRIFRVVNGLRRTLPGARAPVAIDDTRWHTLELRADGPRLTASVDGEVTVSSYDTYLGRGRAGLWTKSDSRTDFDDLELEP